jgi:rhodanese-related sulfurtransferase
VPLQCLSQEPFRTKWRSTVKVKMGTILAVLLFSVTLAHAENYVNPDQFKQWLETSKPFQIVDIQTREEFEKHHFMGSIETNAYPVKSDEEKQRLDQILPVLQASKDNVVVVCPRGGGGAKNTYEHLKSKGIPEDRLFILEKGVDGWPYTEWFVQGK